MVELEPAEVRRWWLLVMGWDESEIIEIIKKDPPKDLDEEFSQLAAAIRLR